jgi:hypothetical protein
MEDYLLLFSKTRITTSTKMQDNLQTKNERQPLKKVKRTVKKSEDVLKKRKGGRQPQQN